MTNAPTTTLGRLTVRATRNHGRGVFAATSFSDGDLIESCDVIVIPAHQRATLDTTVLYDYYYSWGPNLEDGAIGLGFGSLYNHSFRPNALYIKDTDHQKINIVAIRAISAGEEITVNYNGDPKSTAPLWFEPVSEDPE